MVRNIDGESVDLAVDQGFNELRSPAVSASDVCDLLRCFGASWQAGFRAIVAASVVAAVLFVASADLVAGAQAEAHHAKGAGWSGAVVEQEPRPSKPHESPSTPDQPPLDAVSPALQMDGFPSVAQTDAFPTIAQLEAAVDGSARLRELALEIERLRLQQSWWNRVRLHANTSQHFSSFPLLVASPELAMSGGTFVGVTVSVPVGTLAGKTDPADLQLPLKRLEYERERERIVSSLRRMHLQRQKLLVQRRALSARIRTAGLELEKIRLGRRIAEQEPSPLLPFLFDAIDLARAEEKLAVLESDRLQADLEIQVLEIEMLALVGWQPESQPNETTKETDGQNESTPEEDGENDAAQPGGRENVTTPEAQGEVESTPEADGRNETRREEEGQYDAREGAHGKDEAMQEPHGRYEVTVSTRDAPEGSP